MAIFPQPFHSVNRLLIKDFKSELFFRIAIFSAALNELTFFLEEAEAEEAERKEADANKMTSLENLKYYTSLFLGTACIVNVFAFLFLVPFVLDPAISTLRHR